MEGIAIIGMAGRFPGAPDVDSFWRNLKDGTDSISRFSEDEIELGAPRDAPEGSVVHARGILDDIEMFDARFFGFLPPEAELLDPQQRVFLELAWQAVEHAGYDVQRSPGAVGVFAGSFMSTYLLANLCSREDFLAQFVRAVQTGALQVEMGNEKDHLATHVAFRLGLRGPAMTIQTACSTSLVAIATACSSLRARECDLALAGGVTIVVPQKRAYAHREGSILSVDGVCRPFDAQASGTVFSNGGGALLLRRLDDALAAGDTIHAVIRGHAVNNDGNRKVNYTAPSSAGQAEVVRQAFEAAGVEARSIGYIEAHGTGTQVGDPIEIAGLTAAFRTTTQDTGFCALGSLKANIGHLDVGAGVAGIIKAALVVRDGVIPPLAHFSAPNPRIDLAATPFVIDTGPRPWRDDQAPRRAGVSSFGLGGTNVHMVLEEPPRRAPRPESQPGRRHEVFPLSARSDAALAAQARGLAAHLEANPEQDLADVAWTLQAGRRQFDKRRIVVAADRAGLVEQLRKAAPSSDVGPVAARDPQVVFMFPGQGTQYPDMGRALFDDEPVFRETVEQCMAALAGDPAVDFDLREFLLRDPAQGDAEAEVAAAMEQTKIAQPAIFTLEIALARLLVSWGVRPAAVVGHSVGEFAAACIAGVFTLEDAVRLVALRGRLMQALPAGRMLAVQAEPGVLAAMLGPELSIAAINSPGMTVVSGPADAIAALAREAAAAELRTTELRTSHAFHSPMMAPVLEPLRQAIAAVDRAAPACPMHSTALARPLSDEEACDPAYWAQQVMDPVRFAETIGGAAGKGRRVLLEVGPRQGLSSFSRQVLGPGSTTRIVACLSGRSAGPAETAGLLAAVGRLWIAGVEPDWAAMHAGSRQRIVLPGYPFERKRFWLEPGTAFQTAASGAPAPAPAPVAGTVPVAAVVDDDASAPVAENAPRTEAERLIAGIWRRALGVDDLCTDDNFFDLGGHSLLAVELIAEIRKQTGVRLTPNQFAFETLGQLAAAVGAEAGTAEARPAAGLLRRILGRRGGA